MTDKSAKSDKKNLSQKQKEAILAAEAVYKAASLTTEAEKNAEKKAEENRITIAALNLGAAKNATAIRQAVVEYVNAKLEAGKVPLAKKIGMKSFTLADWNDAAKVERMLSMIDVSQRARIEKILPQAPLYAPPPPPRDLPPAPPIGAIKTAPKTVMPSKAFHVLNEMASTEKNFAAKLNTFAVLFNEVNPNKIEASQNIIQTKLQGPKKSTAPVAVAERFKASLTADVLTDIQKFAKAAAELNRIGQDILGALGEVSDSGNIKKIDFSQLQQLILQEIDACSAVADLNKTIGSSSQFGKKTMPRTFDAVADTIAAPMQRMAKWPLLLKELQKDTVSLSPAQQSQLTACLKAVNEKMDQIGKSDRPSFIFSAKPTPMVSCFAIQGLNDAKLTNYSFKSKPVDKKEALKSLVEEAFTAHISANPGKKITITILEEDKDKMIFNIIQEVAQSKGMLAYDKLQIRDKQGITVPFILPKNTHKP